MRIARDFSLPLAVLLFAVVLIPSSGWAGTGSTTKNCPVEPTQTTIASGLSYYGSNCVLTTTGDVDSFTFTGSAGDIWSMSFGPDTPSATEICLELYDPNGNIVIEPTCVGSGPWSLTQKLTVVGTYTIDIYEVTTNEVISYGLSLERIYQAPPDGIPLVLSKSVAGVVTPPTAMDAYTLYGDTTGTYQVNVSVTGLSSGEICFSVYQPDGTIVGGATCFGGTNSFSTDVTPSQDGTLVVVISEAGNVNNANYSVDVSCLHGVCKTAPPKCTLMDTATYASGTLTMKFTVGTPVAAKWRAWLTDQNSNNTLLFSTSLPITEPAVTMTKASALAASGKVGILSTLTTATGGITCSSWQTVNTGKP